ncbi:MAG: glycosyltransferase family 39 protein [Chloroflexi bacterium]|nr:glycosyltransferase family 39 protein [Chloroflexota bacterium]
MGFDWKSRVTVEHALYAGCLGVALFLRLQALGRAPLEAGEAHEALAALAVAGRAAGGPAPLSPGYASLTALLFALFGGGDALARLIPALAGALFVLLPLCFRRELGRLPALLLAGWLAVSALFGAASRTAGGPMLAVASVGLTVACARRYLRDRESRWLIATAVALGASLTAGPTVITGWLTLGIALGLGRLLRLPGEAEAGQGAGKPAPSAGEWRAALLAGGLATFGLATFVSLYPAGLGALGEQVVHWLLPPARWPAAFLPLGLAPDCRRYRGLALYEPLALAFGLIGAVRAVRTGEAFRARLALWAGVAFLFVLVFPGRTAGDMLWVALPLGALAAGELSGLLRLPEVTEDRLALISQVALLLVLFAFGWLALATYSRGLAGQSPYVAVGAFGLALLVSAMYALGWSRGVALLGGGLGLALALAIYGFSAMWGLTRLHATSPLEPWNDCPTATGVRLLEQTLRDVSNRSTGAPADLELVVQGRPDSALGWALRDFHNARYLEALSAEVAAAAVITPQDTQNPTLGSAYIGQAFAIRELPTCCTGDPAGRPYPPPNWAKWLVFRQGDLQPERVILWVREDVQLPGAAKP